MAIVLLFICSAIPGYAGAAAQATIVQPGQTAYVAAAPHAPTYETYQQSQTAVPQYAFATRSQVRIMYISFSCDLLLT